MSVLKSISKKKISNILLILFSIISVLLIAVGSFLSNPFGPIIISIGAAILGAIIGTTITGLSGLNSISTIGIITEALSPGFNSDDIVISQFRKVYHFYHSTEIDKQNIWRYSKIDFSRYYPLGRLKGNLIEKRLDNRKNRELEAMAGIWGDRFIILMNAKDEESRQVVIFPFMGKTYLDIQAGFCLFESWDQNHVITPCILSLSNLLAVEQLGTVDNNFNEKLHGIWKNQFSDKIKVTI